MSNNLEQKDNNEPNNRIIVYNLNFDTDEIGLRDYFSKYGEVLNVEIPISQNRSRGFGFVTFSSIEEATKANDPTIVHELNDRKVRTSFANKREKERDDEFRVKKLYIGKLPHEINETELKEYFEQFGTVSDAFISSVKFAPLLNGFPQHKGYGFVTFENDEDANKAVKQKSHVLKGANIFVRKAIPQRDEERSSKGERRNKNNNNSRSKSNKGGRSERSERSNKDTGSSTTKSESSSSNQDNSSTTTTQTGTYSPSTNNNNNTPTEKKTVVVKRKDNDNKSTETSSTTTNNTNTTPTTNNTPSENKTETTSSNKSTSSNKTSSSNKSSSNNNDNKKKSITVNQKNTKPVITIQKSSTVNPWKTQQNTTPSQPLNNEFPSLGKKKTKTTTKTVTTTTVTTTITVDDKDSKDDKENN